MPIGVSTAMKSKSQKSEHIVDKLVGHSIDSLVLSIQVAFVEVILIYLHFNMQGSVSFLLLNLIVGFQVFTRNCSNCHGMIGKKYDYLLEKVYEQI